MRDPRPQIVWSKRRVCRRVAYAAWMASDNWLVLRRQWHGTWISRYGEPPACAVCDEPWTLRRDDLHHRSYDRLGHEQFGDLVPLCRTCHTRLHQLIESSSAWQRLGRPRATDTAIVILRRHIQCDDR